MQRAGTLAAAILVPAVAGMVAAGCGSDEPKSSAATKPKPLTSEQLITKAGPATVKLWGRYGSDTVSGSGVVIDADKGYVLTNAHVISGVEALKAQVGDGADDARAGCGSGAV